MAPLAPSPTRESAPCASIAYWLTFAESALAVYAKRPNAYQKPRWDVTVKMDRGDTRVLQQRYEPLLREGDRVRVLGTQLELVES